MRPWSGTINDWLVDYYALATVVLLAAVAIMARVRQPARRLAIARSTVVGLAMLAILAALPGWPRASWRSRPGEMKTDRMAAVLVSVRDSEIPGPAQLESRPPLQERMPRTPSSPTERDPSMGTDASARAPIGPSVRASPGRWTFDWPGLAGRAYVIGVAMVLAWLGVGLWQTTLLRRRSRFAPQASRELLEQIIGEGRTTPDLLVSARLAQPVAVGLLRPTIILPERFIEDEPRCRLEAALAHEWAHLRNGDLRWIALSGLLMPVLFAHPAYWWLRRRTREDQELLADAAAATGRLDYAEALLSWARRMPRPSPLSIAGSLALWERPSQLKRRIVMLLDRNFRVEPTCPRRWGLGIRAATALAVLALSFVTFRPSAVEADAPPGSKVGGDAEAGATARVLDPEGKPVAGATVYRCYPEPGPVNDFRRRYAPGTKGAVMLTRTAPDGSFRLSPEDSKAAQDRRAQVVVMADGFGPAFLEPSSDAAPVFRLVKDDVPIRGRVFDLQGRPVAGAKVQVVGILRPRSGKLDEWIEVLKQEKAAYPAQEKTLHVWSGDDIPMLLPAVEADRDGRFTIKGIGRERIATLIIEGPGIVRLFEYAATRDMPPVKIPFLERDNVPRTDEVFHGATPELAAGPGLEVIGTVRDKGTGKPLADITIQPTMPFGSPFRFFKTTTDAKGQYRLAGLPPKDKYGGIQDILAVAEGGPPYVPTSLKIEETRAPGPIRKDFALGLGTWVRGRVVDRSTGKPVFAELNYYILQDNLHAKGFPRYGTTRFMRPFLTDEDGAFRVAVIPGKGILAAWAPGSYRIATGLETFQDRDAGGLQVIKVLRDEIIPANFNTLVEIDPKVGEESIAVEIGVDPGRTLKGKVIGPDGEPVAGTLMMSAEDFYQRWSEKPLPTAEFEVRALGPHRKRGLIFYHEAKNLAGAYVVKPDEEAPPTVKLEPSGTLTGRLVDRSDLPQAGALLICDRPLLWEKDGAELDKGALPAAIKTDKDGRFRASGLVPGLKYTLIAWKNGQYAGQAVKDVVIQAGESRDLGDVKAEN